MDDLAGCQKRQKRHMNQKRQKRHMNQKRHMDQKRQMGLEGM
jgi:hypothetical protein